MTCLYTERNIYEPKQQNNKILLIKVLQKQQNQESKQNSKINNTINEQIDNNNCQNNKKNDFPSIFTKHKRNQYSGYKQIYINKSKGISFDNETKQNNQYKSQRKYQLNIKNIAKLRKKYSLQPLNRKNTLKQTHFNHNILMNNKNSLKNHIQTQDLYSSQRAIKENQNLRRNNSIKKVPQFNYHYSTQKSQEKDQTMQNTPENQFKIKKFKTERSQASVHILNIAQKIMPLQFINNIQKYNHISNNNKPFSISLKKKLQKRMKRLNKIKIQCNYNSNDKNNNFYCDQRLKNDNNHNTNIKNRCQTQIQEQIQVCGWQNDSFYDDKLQKIYNERQQ